MTEKPARPTMNRLAALGVLLGLVSCSSAPDKTASSGAGVSGAGADGGVTADCAGDAGYRSSAYAPNLTVAGDAGAMTFVLVSANPAPPGVYSNTWTLKLLDAMGRPITDATFPTIKTWMPLHGHPSSVAPTSASNGDGTYSISLYLFMPGLWQITFDAQSGSTTDSAMFTFCVGD